MKTQFLNKTFANLKMIARAVWVISFVAIAPEWAMADKSPQLPDRDKASKTRNPSTKPLIKDKRPPGGDGSMFFRVFVSRNDKNGDGVIQKNEFRGSAARFDQMDKNDNGVLDRAEIDELHRIRMADPLSMRQRIARGETRRPPVDLPADPKAAKDMDDGVQPFALTPLGTRITAEQAYARLDVDRNGRVTASEFSRSPGMGDLQKAAQTVAKVDCDGDGSLSFSEFNAVFAKRHGKQPRAKTEFSLPKPPLK